MIIKFENVGRDKLCWEVEAKKYDYDFLFKEVKRHGVMSNCLDFMLDKNGRGVIFAGLVRPIGNFYIKEKKNDSKN